MNKYEKKNLYSNLRIEMQLLPFFIFRALISTGLLCTCHTHEQHQQFEAAEVSNSRQVRCMYIAFYTVFSTAFSFNAPEHDQKRQKSLVLDHGSTTFTTILV